MQLILFGATNIVRISNKEKYTWYWRLIEFWDSASNAVIFGVDNSLSSHSDNCKNNFLILGEGPTYDINGSSGSPEKNV